MYVAVTAFVFFVIMSSYTAQLTAILASKQVPTQEITSIQSFADAGVPVCVRQNAAQQLFLATFYPNLQVQPVPGLTQAGLLPAIASGVCKGGVGPDPELKYSLGGPGIFDTDGFDPTGASCASGSGTQRVCAVADAVRPFFVCALRLRAPESFCDLQIVGERLTFGYYGVRALRHARHAAHARQRVSLVLTWQRCPA